MLGPCTVGSWVHADDRYSLIPNDDRFGLVAKQPRASKVAQLGSTRERVSGDRDIVVTEHYERALEEIEEFAKTWLSARMGYEITRNTNDVWLPLGDPSDCPCASSTAP
jgi:hypothetical protein